MKRYLFGALWLAGALVVVLSSNGTTAAPVPKHVAPPKPAKLTKELVQGVWVYEWSSLLEGWIQFNDDGTYTAQHNPGTNAWYSGTYTVSDDSITIVEWYTNSDTGTTSGPQCYRFDIDVKGWPVLGGKSTGGFGFDVQVVPVAHTHLKLRDKK